MIVSRAVTDNLTKASWIRRMFEEGARFKQERGAGKVFDYVFPRTPVDDDVSFVRLLADEGVLTVPGSGFGMPGHIRISLTVERDTVVRALPGFERAFRKARGA